MAQVWEGIFANSPTTSVKKPLITGTIAGNSSNYLILNFVGLGYNISNTGTNDVNGLIKVRFRDSSGWGNYLTEVASAFCGGDLKSVVLRRSPTGNPVLPSGYFTVEVVQTLATGVYTWYYPGYINTSTSLKTVQMGPWTVTGTGALGLIRNDINENSWMPKSMPSVPVSYEFVDAVSIIGVSGTNVTLNNSYLGSISRQNLRNPEGWKYRDCYSDEDNGVLTRYTSTGFNFALESVGTYFLVGWADRLEGVITNPDMIISNASATLQYDGSNSWYAICATIKNNGTVSTLQNSLESGFYVHLFLNSADNPPVISTPSTSYTYYRVNLSPGDSFRWCTNKDLSPGTYKVYFWVDTINQIYESNESNNVYTYTFTDDGARPLDDSKCTEADWSYTDGVCESTNTLKRTWRKLRDCAETGGVSHPSEERISCTYTPSTPACTASNWTYSDGVCQSTGKLTRSWNKVGNCDGGVSHPSSEVVSCTYVPPTCIDSNWSYSDEVCQSNNKAKRTWSKIGTCSGGVMHSSVEYVNCTYQSPLCTDENWIFSNGECEATGKLKRTWTKTGTCSGGVNHQSIESVDCIPSIANKPTDSKIPSGAKIVSPLDGEIVPSNDSYVFKVVLGEISPDLSQIKWYIDDKELAQTGYEITYSGLKPGNHQLKVKVDGYSGEVISRFSVSEGLTNVRVLRVIPAMGDIVEVSENKNNIEIFLSFPIDELDSNQTVIKVNGETVSYALDQTENKLLIGLDKDLLNDENIVEAYIVNNSGNIVDYGWSFAYKKSSVNDDKNNSKEEAFLLKNIYYIAGFGVITSLALVYVIIRKLKLYKVNA